MFTKSVKSLHYCRLCAELVLDNSLFDIHNEFFMISNKLNRIQATVDLGIKTLPATVCYECLSALNRAFEFVNVVEKAQETLIKIFHENEQENLGDIKGEKHFIDTNNENSLEVSFGAWQPKNLCRQPTVNEGKPTETSANNLMEGNYEEKANIIKNEDTSDNNSVSISTNLNTSWKDFIWVCSECGIQCSTQRELTQHSIITHSYCNPYYCCDCKIHKENLHLFLLHVRRHRQSLRHSCHNCLKKYSNIRESTTHRCDSKTTSHKCIGCHTTFENEEELKKHTSAYFRTKRIIVKRMSTHEKNRVVDNGKSLSSNQESAWKDFTWTCSECGTQFPTQNELTEHSIKYHNRCNAFCCPECNVSEDYLNKLLTHVNQHVPSLGFSCHICLKKFPTTRGKNRHKCGRKTPHICMGCNSAFESHEDLKKHIFTYFQTLGFSSAHLNKIDLDNFTCNECKRSFKRPMDLMRHLHVHLERNRDHVCEVCGKSFFEKSTLTSHMITHVDKSSFQCDICKQWYKSKTRVRKHIALHYPDEKHICGQCGRGFRFKFQLKNHSIIHTDLHPYECGHCQKKFRFKPLLKQHLRLHTGVKPYTCNVCNKCFTGWSNYNKHMKRRHKMNMAMKKPIQVVSGDSGICGDAEDQ